MQRADDDNILSLIRSIELFMIVDMGHLSFKATQRYKRELKNAIYILDGRRNCNKESGQNHLWWTGKKLLYSENNMALLDPIQGRRQGPYNRHGSMKVRILCSYFPNDKSAISCIKKRSSILQTILQALIVLAMTVAFALASFSTSTTGLEDDDKVH